LPLVQLLSVSASLHFLNYFRRAAETWQNNQTDEPDRKRALTWPERRSIANQAVRYALKPTLCCTLTTSIGLMSLLLSSSLPVRQFGIFSALSVIAASLLMLLWFPAMLNVFGLARKYLPTEATTARPRDAWRFLATFTQTFRWPIIVGSLVALIVCAAGIPKIKTGSELDNFLPAKHEALADAVRVESSTGPLNSIELTLQFSDHDSENERLRLRALRAVCSNIIKRTPVESCISAATFAPQLRRNPTLAQKISELTRLRRVKEELVLSGVLSVQAESMEEVWRVSCRYSTTQDVDVPKLSEQIKSIVGETFYRDGQLILQGETMQMTTTGEFVLFDSVDRQFFQELLTTYITAFCVIAVVVLLVLRTSRAWLTAFLPNLFPAVVVLGTAGHLGYPFDVASLMTASVALGVAVDDTLHFLLWRQETLTDGKLPSIESTMRYCGMAMVQTSVILGVSLFLYAFCGFLPTVRFGILLSAMMFAALVGDLILLPAIVAVGRGKNNTA